MRCPKCLQSDTKVIDSRSNKDNINIRRRRQCPECNLRFNTFETPINDTILVIKRNGMKEDYDSTKIINGIKKAAEKRPINNQEIKNISDNIKDRLQSFFETEISSIQIGDEIMNQLRKIDHITYVRFASVCKNFKNLKDLTNEINLLDN